MEVQESHAHKSQRKKFKKYFLRSDYDAGNNLHELLSSCRIKDRETTSPTTETNTPGKFLHGLVLSEHIAREMSIPSQNPPDFAQFFAIFIDIDVSTGR